jgi:hypothetical protein
MKIQKIDLLSALATVKPGLASQDTLEQTTSFAFIKGRVVTYNDELSISHPVPNLDITGAVDANEIYNLLSKLSAKEIDITVNKDKINIKAGRVKASIKLTEEIVLPVKDEIGKIKDWTEIPDTKQLMDHISFAMKTCSSDMTMLAITCVCLRSNGLIQGTDRFRVVQCQGQETGLDDFLLPATAAAEVVKTEPIEMSLHDSWVHFRNEQDTIISTRIVTEKFIDQERIDNILHCSGKISLTFPKNILKMLDRVSVFAKRDFAHDEIVYADIANGKITLRATSKNGSTIREKDVIETEEELSIALTPSLFHTILNETRTCKISKDLKKLKFVSKKNNWEYTIMLREG